MFILPLTGKDECPLFFPFFSPAWLGPAGVLDMEHIKQVLIHLLSAVVLVWVLSQARKPPKVDIASGCLILKHGWLLRGPGLFSGLALPPLAIGGVLGLPVQTLAQFCVLALISCGMALSGVYLLVETMTVRVILGADGITARSPWRGWRTFLWEE